ncbi:MAG: DUF2314 domain-containing protein [Alphaproteobacteria bacterium]|nr:DUF2314 domain-containing protein [Alphaproteobacteria bacterium]
MQAAMARARETFPYFWRELHWEQRRIVPGLGLAAIKAPFSDEGEDVEQMWVGDVFFDGREVHGTLMNEPNALRSVAQGDPVSLPVREISDWIYTLEGIAYGAFTVNAMRATMSPADRDAHDAAWGLDFGDPAGERLFPASAADGHPMAANMLPSLQAYLDGAPDAVSQADDLGFTLLHSMALGGATPLVRELLARGADPTVPNALGDSALDLARAMGWSDCVALLGG